MRQFIINVNGNSYEVEVEEVGANKVTQRPAAPIAAAPKAAAPAPKAAPAPVAPAPKEEKKEVVVSAGQEVIEAPMPGNIWKIVAKEGDKVKAGDILLILEAMKMENEIVAAQDGTVASINVTQGQAVEPGDVIATLN